MPLRNPSLTLKQIVENTILAGGPRSWLEVGLCLILPWAQYNLGPAMYIYSENIWHKNYKIEALGREKAQNIGPELCTECLKRKKKSFWSLKSVFVLSPAVEREAGDSELCPMRTQNA